MADVRAVPARAAVVNVGQRHGTDGDNTTLRAKSRMPIVAAVVLLPPGVQAAALGRGAFIHATPQWAEAGLGAMQNVTLRLPAWCFEVLFWAGRERPEGGMSEIPGPIDIPVWADPDSGQIIEADADRVLAEFEPHFEIAKKLWKSQSAPLAGVRTVAKAPKLAKGFIGSLTKEWRSAITDMVDDIRGETPQPPGGTPRPSDESHPPIDGVGYRTWVTVRAGLERDCVYPEHIDVYAVHRGVPPGRWEAIEAAWSERATQDTVVQAWSAFDLYRLKPTGARWGDEPQATGAPG